MILELKEDNPFYGKKGTLFNKHILRLIPSKHHSLFQEQVRQSNRSASISDVENYIREAMMNFGQIPPILDQRPPMVDAAPDVPNQPIEWEDEEEPEEDNFDDDDHDMYWDAEFDDDEDTLHPF